MNSATVFMLALTLLIGALAIGCLTFINRMNSNYILIQRGVTPIKHVIDHYGYMQNKKGLIFSLTFFIAGASLLIMITLPSVETKIVKKIGKAPQPVQPERKESSISAIIEPPSKEEKPDEPIAPPTPIAPPPLQAEKLDTLTTPPVEIIEHIEKISTDFDDITEGEDDVVYGTGPISDAAIMHFVHKNPDSALKFLFRKQLDGKALTNVEEAIYTEWENRHLTRGKVKGYILTLMDWKEFPKKPLYETWKEIRDHIYENVE